MVEIPRELCLTQGSFQTLLISFSIAVSCGDNKIDFNLPLSISQALSDTKNLEKWIYLIGKALHVLMSSQGYGFSSGHVWTVRVGL